MFVAPPITPSDGYLRGNLSSTPLHRQRLAGVEQTHCYRSNTRLRLTACDNSGRDIADRPAALNLRRHQQQTVLDASKPLPTGHQQIAVQECC